MPIEDEELKEVKEPNLVFTYPLFMVESDPENIFACDGICWIKEYDGSGPDAKSTDPMVLQQIQKASHRAYELKKFGIILTGKYYTIRDFDKPLYWLSISHSGYGEVVKIFMVEGPRYDMKMIEEGMVTIH